MIKLGRYGYAFQNYDSTKHVSASMREKKISHKHAREVSVAINEVFRLEDLKIKLVIEQIQV